MVACVTRILLGCLDTVLREHTGIDKFSITVIVTWNLFTCKKYKYYCMIFFHRMLVYEYINNGNLEQWLHGDVGDVSPLTWDMRMNILLGTAKGYHTLGLICLKTLFMFMHKVF